jgi:hypothetical protein
MVNSSFFADGGTYDTAVVTSNDHPASTTPSQAPSSFYPSGTTYNEADEVASANSASQAAASAAAALASQNAAHTSETNAGSSATAAANSATNSATSAAAALASQNAAHTSETNAAGSATAASGSASAASGSATAAAGSATAASGSASAAATSATNAANSATAASGSASAASTSASNAATSATNAATSATNAATAVQSAAGTVTPNAPGTAAVGTSTKWAHEDHVHPKDSTKADLTLLNQSVPVGQCKLVYTSATQLTLKPFSGQNLKINGGILQVPSAGVTLSNSGLSASTLYYIYAYQPGFTGTTINLVASTSAHATSATAGNVGTEILSGDDHYTLVGMVYTNASSQFVDSTTNRQVRSWFNESGVTGGSSNASVVGTTSASAVELDTAMRCFAVLWANELFNLCCISQSFASVANQIAYNYCLLNGGAVGNAGIAYSVNANTQAQGVSVQVSSTSVDTFATFSMGMQSSSTGSTANYASRIVDFNTRRSGRLALLQQGSSSTRCRRRLPLLAAHADHLGVRHGCSTARC